LTLAQISLAQGFRYEYPQPITDLEQRLVVVPPLSHGAQRRVRRSLDVSVPVARWHEALDRFGNVIVSLSIPVVETSVSFDAEVVVEHRDAALPHLVAPDPCLLRPTGLTAPDPALAAAARRLRTGAGGRALAERVCEWVHGALVYDEDATDVATTAAEALALGRGVCQDSAHVMLTVCRSAGVAARYVSGHLLGQGGSHAWVEVLLDDGAAWEVLALDPCNGRETGPGYVTVAVGRDYADVAPTSGTYNAPTSGFLRVTKRAEELAAA